MIDTLDASKITTGELNASLIRVVNLDASSISGNEANFIRALFDGTKSILEITGDRLSIINNKGFASTSFESDGMTFYGDGEKVADLKYRKYAGGTSTSRPKNLNLRLEDDAQMNISRKNLVTGFDERFITLDGGNGNIYTTATIRSSINNDGIKLGGGSVGGTPVVFIEATNGGGIAIGSQDFFYKEANGWKRMT